MPAKFLTEDVKSIDLDLLSDSTVLDSLATKYKVSGQAPNLPPRQSRLYKCVVPSPATTARIEPFRLCARQDVLVS